MQHQLRILPEALPEVPRESKRSQFQDVGGPSDRRFDEVYQKHLNDKRDDSLAQQEKAANLDTAKNGNTKPPEHQTGGFKPSKPVAHETGGVKPSKPMEHETGGFKPSHSGAKDGSPQMEGQTAPINGEGGSRDTIDPAMEHLLAFIEKSDSVLQNPQSMSTNGANGNDLLKQNKLSAAIESVLTGDHKDLKSMLAAFATELEQLANGADNAELSAAQKQLAGELKQLLQGAGNGPLSLKDLQNADLSKDLKTMLNDALKGGVKSEVMSGQTPGINPNADGKAKYEIAMNANADKQGNGQTPPIIDGELADIELAAQKSTANATPGINPNGGQDGKPIKPNAGDVEIKPTVRPAQASQQHKPFELEADTAKLDPSKFDTGQTPGINPGEEDAQVTKPMELAGDKGKPNLFSQDGVKPAKTDIPSENGVNIKPMEKADPMLASMVAENAKRDNKNILGTPDKSKSNNNTIKELQAGNTGQANIDESKLAQESSEQPPSDQSMSEEHRQMVEDKFARFSPKDLANLAGGKGQSSTSGFVNNLTGDSLSSLHSLQQADKGAAKLPPQLTEAINIARPEFGANMKERMMVMMNKGIQSADIRLDPAELGQMQVKMSVENDVTSVSFVVQNSQAKELLEQALPKLKDMLAEQGIDLGEGSVHQEDKEQPQWDASQDGNNNQQAAQSDESEQEVDPMVAQQVKIAGGSLGGIDFFA